MILVMIPRRNVNELSHVGYVWLQVTRRELQMGELFL